MRTLMLAFPNIINNPYTPLKTRMRNLFIKLVPMI